MAAPAASLSPSQTYQELLRQRDALYAGKKASQSRQAWENLEKGFDRLASTQAGELGPKAAYQRVKTRALLAEKSARREDFAKAAEGYAAFARAFPRHAWADDALYNQASILAKNLGDSPSALKALAALEKNNPNGDFKPKAKALRKELEGGQGQPKKPEQPNAKGADNKRDGAVTTASGTDENVPAPGKEAVKPAKRLNPAEAAKLYSAKAAEWRALKAAPAARSGKREAWLGLEGDFKEIEIMAQGSATAEKAAFQAARSREELARRSQQRADWEEAAELYAAVAANYPSSSLADDSLYAQALILDKRMKNPQKAALTLESMLEAYPKGDMARNGKTLAAKLKGQGKTRQPENQEKPQTLAEQLGLTVRTIMIDPGHGGKDPGAAGNGVDESAYVLALAKNLGDKLGKAGFTVLYTREKDIFIPLEDRTKLANNQNADLFISIHVNANRNESVNGLEVYYLDVARSNSAIKVAARENGVSTQQISDLQFILSDLMRDTKLGESKELANSVLKNMLSGLRKNGFSSSNNGVRSAPFYVLLGARMPAILIEVGYLTNDGEAKRMKNPLYVEKAAEGIANGIVSYKQQLAKLGMRGGN